MRNRDKEKIISIDFDGVIAEYHWYKWENIIWEPMSWALQFIKKIIENWYTPVIYTTRKIDLIEKWIKKNRFPEIEVTNTKYPSVLYIDDRCIQFNWDYKHLKKQMQKFDVHRRRKDKKIFEDLKI